MKNPHQHHSSRHPLSIPTNMSCDRFLGPLGRWARHLTTQVQSPARPRDYSRLDPNTVSGIKEERALYELTKTYPIGSRRRRAAMRTSDRVPFEQLPYQCFQEARKVLAQDREEILGKINIMRRRVARLPRSLEQGDKARLIAREKHLENLKICADINDPEIKKRFEDGLGDMSRPIYRHLAREKWSRQNRLIAKQRVEQFRLAPDLLAEIEPTCSLEIAFGRHRVKPGEFISSHVTQAAPRLKVQVFDRGQRLVTIAVVDPDIPDISSDSFTSRCHYLAVNVPLSPTSPDLKLGELDPSKHIVHSWLAPYAQKGAPYHRLAVFVLQQSRLDPLDLATVKDSESSRDGWTIKKLLRHHKHFKPLTASLFRTVWDEHTDDVMAQLGVSGREVELIRCKPERNVYKKKDGGRYR